VLNVVSRMSIRSRFAVPVLIMAVFAGFIFYVFPARERRTAMAALENKAESIAKMVARYIPAGLEFKDKDTVLKALEGASTDRDLAYIVVWNASGEEFTELFVDEKRKSATFELPAEFENRDGEDYLEVIEAKTAKLFAAATEIGAVVSDRPVEERQALEAFGHNIGMAFQLIDDVLDYSARQATLGKTVGDDFRDGKITLPVVLAFQAGDEEARGFWRRTLEDLEQKKGDLKRASQMLESTGALQATVERARYYGRLATEALDVFPESEHKLALAEAVDFAVNRSH